MARLRLRTAPGTALRRAADGRPLPGRDLTPGVAAPHLRPAGTGQLIFQEYSASGVLVAVMRITSCWTWPGWWRADLALQ